MNSSQLRSSLSGAASPPLCWTAVMLLLPFGAASSAICVQIAPGFLFRFSFTHTEKKRPKTGSPLTFCASAELDRGVKHESSNISIHQFFDKLPSVPNELITNQPAYDPAEPSSQKRPRALLEHEFINFPQAKRLRVQT
ncbi:hypothetical protein TNCV_982171 [Trichonephila clavipes]|nr:hypothetical protein TNCV_982171 [Trichonephila clavipes]